MPKKPSYEELTSRVKELEVEAAKRKKVEKELQESKNRLSQIVQGSSIPTFVIDHNHLMTHCNRAYENLTGLSAKDVVGTRKQWLSFYASERPVLADLIVENASEEKIARLYGGIVRKSTIVEGSYEAEAFFPALGDRGRWIFFTAAPLKDAAGNITGALETLQDVSERKWTEEVCRKLQRLYKTFLDFLPYPVVVFNLDGRVYYVNPEFTNIFGWTLQELEGKKIPYVPPGLEKETSQMIKKLFQERTIQRYETRRLTKDGRVLDVVMRGSVYSESEDEPGGELVIFRDVTKEKRIARNSEAMLRISMALPEYPDLEELLYYISHEVKSLLNSEGALVVLHDEDKGELFFSGTAFDDTAIENKVKGLRFSLDQLIAGRVIETGKPIIVSDVSEEEELHLERDKKFGYKTRNLLLVPLKSIDRSIGVLAAINKKEGNFDTPDLELLNMTAGTVSLSVENARFSDELKRAYREVTSLNRAKDKVIHHLSHELKTPVSVVSGSLNVLLRKLAALPDENWKRTYRRIERNLNRIVEIQEQVDDIMREEHYKSHDILMHLLSQCTDELETLIAEEIGEAAVIDRVRRRIEEIFGSKEELAQETSLDAFVRDRICELRKFASHRHVEIITCFEPPPPPICIPEDPLRKVVDGLIKNAIENTPDEGKIEVIVGKHGEGAYLTVRDYGVGITEDAQKRIFEGFFVTQDTMEYSSKRPFDFNAGGKGADLLRMKIFSERYHFRIEMHSVRCGYIPTEKDRCPGRITLCPYCDKKENCYQSGETTFSVYFPSVPTSDSMSS